MVTQYSLKSTNRYTVYGQAQSSSFSKQGSHRDWTLKIVLENSWNMKNWSTVITFCDQSCNCAPNLIIPLPIFADNVTLRNLASVQKARIFIPFPQNITDAKFDQGDGHGPFLRKAALFSPRISLLFIERVIIEERCWAFFCKVCENLDMANNTL